MSGDAADLTPDSATKIAHLRLSLQAAKRYGASVRREWLDGRSGGACEVAGKRFLFVDLSLSIDEQIDQVEEAFRLWEQT